MGKHETPALSVAFNSDVPRIPGEVLEGEVNLYFPALISDDISEVHIKLRGIVVTMVTISSGPQDQRVELVRETISLWQKGEGSAYPPPGSDTLALPFRFQLPTELPPSCSYGGSQVGWEGTVRYAIEAVGVRPRLHLNRRMRKAFPLLPTNVQGAELRAAILAEGWQGGWKATENQDNVRKGIWGDYSQVKASLITPDFAVYPTHTPIPFTLTIVTLTKPMNMSDIKEGEPIFPSPPRHLNDPKELSFELSRAVFIDSYRITQTHKEVAMKGVGGIGDIDSQSHPHVQVEPMENVWVPAGDSHDKKAKGQWKQGVTIRSSFTLNQVPTFDVNTMNIRYTAKVKVGFPGVGNDLKLDLPVTIISCVPPSGTQAWDGQPPEFDLPPGYFAGDDTWFDDDKKE